MNTKRLNLKKEEKPQKKVFYVSEVNHQRIMILSSLHGISMTKMLDVVLNQFFEDNEVEIKKLIKEKKSLYNSMF